MDTVLSSIIVVGLKKVSFQGHEGCPSWLEAEWACGIRGVWLLRGLHSQSWYPITKDQSIPLAAATCPSPSLRVHGEGDGQMALEGQAASLVQHPPNPQPQSSMPGPSSTLWPPPPPSSPIHSPNPWAPVLVSAAWLGKHSPSLK